MKREYLKLKDIICLFDSEYELYYKGSYMGVFDTLDTPETWCLECRICAIKGNSFGDYNIFEVYLTEDVGDRMF